MKIKPLRSVFVNNRAEQLPDDVWKHFVLPIHFEKIDLGEDAKSVLIAGGRGCGKTMFIRYYCHATLFSKDRGTVADTSLSHIGIYWKPDVKICNFIARPGWIKDDLKDSAFQHLAALEILSDFCRSLKSIEHADFVDGSIAIGNINVPDAARVYFDDNVRTYNDLDECINRKLVEMDMWMHNPERPKPTFLNFAPILERLCHGLSAAETRFGKIFYRIFIDEFENLHKSQQKLINDHIKHPSKYFCINIATRRHAKIYSETSGFERVVETHDYRKVDLEHEFLTQTGKSAFSLLASEVLLMRLARAGYELEGAPSPESLMDVKNLANRKSIEYQKRVKSLAAKMFPTLSYQEIARLVLDDKSLRFRLEKLIKRGLKVNHANTKFRVEDFINENVPDSTVVCACLLNRKRSNAADLHHELDSAAKGKASKLSSESDWVSGNLVGVLFYLYLGLPKRPCLLYSGFDRFCQIARSNLRYFQELCHQSFSIYESENFKDNIKINDLQVDQSIQAEAAKITSGKMLTTVGDFGVDLYNVVRRLGRIFQLSHKRPSQSEPEITHFSISGSFSDEKQNKIDELIHRAITWSVFYESKDTKNKGPSTGENSDLVPNPIFMPYFGVSYRKKRKLSLSASEFLTIVEADEESFNKLWRTFQQRWDVPSDADQQQRDLF
ncbi:MAG: hypothetical protein GYB30_05725 [Gammaproteobacteria bacterium]|nr:hypothetical protein [Gammaproteobacteria bacterium]